MSNTKGTAAPTRRKAEVKKVKRVSKYAPTLTVTCLLKEEELPPAKRNGRNPYPYYLAFSGKTIGEILKAGRRRWEGRDAVVPADFWWDSVAREERGPAVIKIG